MIGLVAVGVLGAGGIVLVRAADDTAAAGPAATPGPNTATVSTRDIRRTTTLDGTVGHGAASPLTVPGSGTLTWLPAVGAIVSSGERVAEVDGRPVVLLAGERPAWRDLGSGIDDGADIRQLEQALSDLGFGSTSLEIDDEWTAATTTAVKTFQRWMGMEVDGRLALGDVVFGPATVRIDAVAGHVGEQVGNAGIEVTGDQQVVTATAAPSDSDLVAPGTKVAIELPSGRSVTGVVTDVGAPTTEGGTTTLPVTVVADGALDAVDGLGVDVEITVVAVPGATAVPATALLALAEGGYAVEVPDASAPGGTRLVGVEVGAFDEDGWVQITGDVAPGDQVVVP